MNKFNNMTNFIVPRPIEKILQLIKDGNNKEFGIDRLKCLKKMLPDSSEV